MANPRIFNNRLNPDEPGDGAEEVGGVEARKGRCGEGGGRKERASHDPPPPPVDPEAGDKRANRPERV